MGRRGWLITFALLLASPAAADTKETVDIATVAFPDGWKREAKERTYVMHESNGNGKLCRLYAYVHTTGTGAIASDFDAEWATFAPAYNLGKPSSIKPRAIAGWSAQGGQGTFSSGGNTFTVNLYVYSAGTRRIAYAVVTNDLKAFSKPITAFLGSISLPTDAAEPAPAPVATPPATKSTFKFTTTKFDDGWTAVDEASWVRGTKGQVTVLIHHQLPDIRSFMNVDEATAHVWKTLVAPRYSNISNLWSRRSFWSDGDSMSGKYFASADAKSGDKSVHVALYKVGNAGRWIEVITPDKATFQKELTVVEKQDGTNWQPLTNLGNLNKFAVAASDLVGTWASSSGAQVQYVHIYTGNSAGTAYASSTNEFVFKKDGTYESVYKGAMNTQNGAGTVFHGEKAKGKATVANYEITLTGRSKPATQKFTVQFEAVAGGRILHMWRGNIEEIHLFKVK